MSGCAGHLGGCLLDRAPDLLIDESELPVRSLPNFIFSPGVVWCPLTVLAFIQYTWDYTGEDGNQQKNSREEYICCKKLV